MESNEYKLFKVKAISMYGDPSDEKSFEEWEEEIYFTGSKKTLKNMLSCNNKVISIEEINENKT